ncbi:MAG: capsular biosynthesis protein [Zymomonas mobilis]|uniref:Capsular polysaccharide export protein n=1 Tax=Zymomonas mobilis TaxID=542 RepID=A0A542VZR9_ZYMMB|nr:capsular biosynthesis protein [Zymomonas mobilis]TQL16818.1 capsular polysaccharide export protein [Zymomonas mobilis]
MPLSLPFLRLPPFPKATVTLADFVQPRIHTGQPQDNAPLSLQESEALVKKLTKMRVGGAFWATPLPQISRKQRIFIPDDQPDAALFATMANKTDLFILLDQKSDTALAENLKKQGFRVHLGLFDPWSLIGQTREIICSGRSIHTIDIGLVARLGNMPIRLSPTARPDFASLFASPDMTTAELVNRLLAAFQYYDIFTKKPISLRQAIAQLSEWRVLIDSNRPIKAACGMAWWKKQAIRSFLWSGTDETLPMPRKTEDALAFLDERKDAIALWPSREPTGLRAAVAKQHALYEVEDGFIRSVGLGSGLHPPLSIVVDKQGIYYDPSHPSDIETLFNQTRFSKELIDRTKKLITRIQSAHISKYMGTETEESFSLPTGKRIVLVTGQVEDDRSVRLGGGAVKGNLDLLRRAREAEADSYIIFKPHPDVEAGHRKGFVSQGAAEKYADIVIRHYPIAKLLDQVDAVHVWTSLAGFEALLRHREVICHGTPFYAGWGLTRDLGHIPARRKRRLDITELAAVTLILYPRYLDPETGVPCSPEVLIERLIDTPKAKMTPVTWIRHFQGKFCTALRRATVSNPRAGKS